MNTTGITSRITGRSSPTQRLCQPIEEDQFNYRWPNVWARSCTDFLTSRIENIILGFDPNRERSVTHGDVEAWTLGSQDFRMSQKERLKMRTPSLFVANYARPGKKDSSSQLVSDRCDHPLYRLLSAQFTNH